MEQFNIKTTVFSDYGLANAVFEQLKHKEGWRFPDNSSSTLVWESSFNVKDADLDDYGHLSVLIQLKLCWNPLSSEQFATYTIKYQQNTVSSENVNANMIVRRAPVE